jgi:hypothetical protein
VTSASAAPGKRRKRIAPIPTILDNLGAIASIASLPAAVITVAAWMRSSGTLRRVILSIAFPIAIAAYAFDIADRLGWITLKEASDPILGWGVNNDTGTFWISVNSRPLLTYRNDYKIMEVIQIPFANVDKMTDMHIEKSVLYTITGGPMVVALTLSSPSHLGATWQNIIPDKAQLLTNFTLVLVPSDLSPDQIRSLSDVLRLGGKIIGTGAENVVYNVTRQKAEHK